MMTVVRCGTRPYIRRVRVEVLRNHVRTMDHNQELSKIHVVEHLIIFKDRVLEDNGLVDHASKSWVDSQKIWFLHCDSLMACNRN